MSNTNKTTNPATVDNEFVNPEQWSVSEDSYTIRYKLLYSVNPYFEEYELWEYGIRCELYNQNLELLNDSVVRNISKDKSYVNSILDLLIKHKVFPVHLIDVISDKLIEDTCYAS
ncbi:DUF6514 family protein [Lachnoclostridium phytofermentans]|uniref:Uncharacterized protein n=1 Tax=Lachnoclostridium phytofermentans (strain ATCC 700394 / DSM 18823 / ISDg) TaxID=357809 RepID=A9KK73_LACP7|nr:DUF6514 family protein [Lachnoclostridium phytofermentans]ABX44064.1 hypothetical protein Cphy_3717 [Lachnoclostridium phytofermentans ISDg]